MCGPRGDTGEHAALAWGLNRLRLQVCSEPVHTLRIQRHPSLGKGAEGVLQQGLPRRAQLGVTVIPDFLAHFPFFQLLAGPKGATSFLGCLGRSLSLDLSRKRSSKQFPGQVRNCTLPMGC